jgi:aldose 1-epimerase
MKLKRRIERPMRQNLMLVLTLGVVACSTPGGGQSEPQRTADTGRSAAGITAAPFGMAGDTPVQLYTLTNQHGLIAKITNFGAILTELHVPDRNGAFADVVLGFESLDGYVKVHPYFGAIVGRVANRIGNAEFTLDGRRYPLVANNGPHHLHGGT